MNIQAIHQNIYDTIINKKFRGNLRSIINIPGYRFKFEHEDDAKEFFSILQGHRNGHIVYTCGGNEVLMAKKYFVGIIRELTPNMESTNSEDPDFRIFSQLDSLPNILDIEVPRSLLLQMPMARKKLVQPKKTEAELKAENKRLKAEAQLLRDELYSLQVEARLRAERNPLTEALLQGGGEAADSPTAQEAGPGDGGGVGIFSSGTKENPANRRKRERKN